MENGKGKKKVFLGRILFLSNQFSPHLTDFALPQMKMLQKWGFEIEAGAPGGCDALSADGIVCRDIPFRRSPYHPGNLFALFKLLRIMKRECYTMLHIHTPVPAFLGRLAARFRGRIPVVYTAHGFHFYQGAPFVNRLVYFLAEKLAARWTKVLVVINEEDTKAAIKMGFRQGDNLFYVPGVGVDIQRYSGGDKKSIQAELRIGSGEVIYLCVAEMNRNKNQSMLLDAWRSLELENARLLLAGEGSEEQRLRRYVSEKAIQGVEFLGQRRDIPALLAAADIVVLPSRREGLPRCILEAMAAGKPVIASNIRGCRDLVAREVTGMLVDIQKPDQLLSALMRMYLEKSTRENMGLLAREAVEKYRIEKIMADISAVYLRALQMPDRHRQPKFVHFHIRIPKGHFMSTAG